MAGPVRLTLALFYAACLGALQPWGRWGLVIALAMAAFASGACDASSAPADDKLTAWALDVGQWTSTVIRLPQGQVFVVDAGGGYGDLDFGQRVVAPFLWSRGLKKVEALVGSYPHPDHVGGLLFLACWLDPRQIWINGRGSTGGMLAEARQRGVKDIASEMDLGGARLRLLWPPTEPPRFELSENDASLGWGWGWIRPSSGCRGTQVPGWKRRCCLCCPPRASISCWPPTTGAGAPAAPSCCKGSSPGRWRSPPAAPIASAYPGPTPWIASEPWTAWPGSPPTGGHQDDQRRAVLAGGALSQPCPTPFPGGRGLRGLRTYP